MLKIMLLLAVLTILRHGVAKDMSEVIMASTNDEAV